MRSNAQLVSQAVEQALARRVAAPFAPAERAVERIPFGIDAMDELVHGGAPIGAISELVGPACSGRTTAGLSLVSHFTRAGSVCAWVDVSDALSPEAAAVNGVDLTRLLWVRCGAEPSAPPTDPSLHRRALTAIEFGSSSIASTGGNSPHPRSEGRNMPQAIQAMLGQHGGLLDHQERRERRVAGTPGAPNRPLTSGQIDRQEQVPTDRLPSRRGESVAVSARCAEPKPRRLAKVASSQRILPATYRQTSSRDAGHGKPWQEMDQALRATDLLLANGGFAVIVLDLGSIPAEFAWRIPLATWFRYRAACERSRTSLLLLTQHPCARSSAGLVVRFQPGTMEAEGPLMTSVRFEAMTERIRFAEQPSRVVSIRKPPQSELGGHWKSEAVWS
jgi:recombination protein RecA